MKKTIHQKLTTTKMKRPPKLLYRLIGNVVKLIKVKELGVKYIYKIDIKKIKGPFLLVSNHASRSDFVYTGFAFLPHVINFVVGHNEFYRSHLKGILGLLKAIPKKNFTPDVYAVKEILRILREGGNVCIMPEGMSSISGENQPIALGTEKLIKKAGVPVYYTHIHGGYLSETKYCLDLRRGKTEVIIDRLFSAEEVASLSEKEIHDILEEKIYHDDYAYNKNAQVSFDGHGEIAKDMERLLYICPTCGQKHVMKSDKNKLYCTVCGAGAEFDDKYNMTPLTENSLLPESPSMWYRWQRQLVRAEIKANPDFTYSQKVKLGVLPEYKPLKNMETSIVVGEGELSLDKTGLRYQGTKNGEEFSFFLPIEQVPTYGMCTDVTRFYTFYNGEFLEFYPETNKVAEWFLTTEETHRAFGGKWQDFKWDKPVTLHKGK